MAVSVGEVLDLEVVADLEVGVEGALDQDRRAEVLQRHGMQADDGFGPVEQLGDLGGPRWPAVAVREDADRGQDEMGVVAAQLRHISTSSDGGVAVGA